MFYLHSLVPQVKQALANSRYAPHRDALGHALAIILFSSPGLGIV
jgi:hypothetical protein